MFVESELTWTIAVKPSDLKSGLHIQRALLRKLLADFDKLKCSEKHGYYICVTTLEGIGEGKIWEGKGCVAYKVRFRCLTYKPQKHEKVFAVVTGEPLEKGVMCCFGAIENMFLSAKTMKDQYTFLGASETKPAHYKGKDGSVIQIGSVLRVEIMGVKYNSLSRVYETLCSVSGDFLGVEKRTWADKTKPEAAAEWGAKLDTDRNDGGGWDCDTHAENGGDGWGASPPKESGGAVQKTDSVRAWDAVPAKSSGRWDDVTSKETDNGGGWETEPAKKAGNSGGWGADTPSENTGGFDSAHTKKSDSGGVWDASPAPEITWDAPPAGKSGGRNWSDVSPGKEDGGRKNTGSGDKSKVSVDSGDAGAWGSSPAKKSRVGSRDSNDTAKEVSASGGWDTVEVENTGGCWGN